MVELNQLELNAGGISAGVRVAILSNNRLDYQIWFVNLWHKGLTVRELVYFMNDEFGIRWGEAEVGIHCEQLTQDGHLRVEGQNPTRFYCILEN